MDGSFGVYPRSRRLRAEEPADLAVLARAAWRGETYRLGPGAFLFDALRIAVGPGCCIGRWECRGATRVRLRLAPGSVHVAFLQGDDLRIGGRRVTGEVMAVTVGDARLDASSTGVASGVEISVPAAALEALANDSGTDPAAGALLERWRARADGETVLTPVEHAAAGLRARLQAALDGGLAAEAETLLTAVRGALATTVAGPDPRSTGLGRRRHRLAAAAEEIIWTRVRTPEPGDTSLDGLCAALGTTRRTLQLAFQEHFGVNFGLLTRAARLHRVRAELRSGNASVSDTAFRLGFEHLGRFAGYYRAFYGENPSVTLRASAR